MRCVAVRDELNRLVDAELPPRMREDIERHLEMCPDCRQALARLQEVAGVFAGVDLPPVPDGFTARVMRQARAQMTETRFVWWSAWNLLRWWRDETLAMRTAAASVVVAGLAVGLAMSGGAFRPSAGPRPATEASPVVQNLDFVGGVPAGSLEQTYLAWVADIPEKRP